MNKLKELYISFFKIGLFTFGGGYAMLPILKREVVDKQKWVSEEEMLDIYAIGQCTPGIIAVNTATYIGYYQSGVLGGLAATLGEISPSLIIILIIASVLGNFMELEMVLHAFAGIRIGVCALLINTIINMGKKTIQDKVGLLLFLVAMGLVLFTPISIIFIILGAAAIGILLYHKKDSKKEAK